MTTNDQAEGLLQTPGGEMKNPKSRHLCNAYCSEEEHCDVFYSSPLDEAAAEGILRQCLGYYVGLKVTRVVPAREPPSAALATEYIVRGSKPATQAWLVWWLRRGPATVER